MIVTPYLLYGIKSSKRCNNHNIIPKKPHPNSLAGYILLKKMYEQREGRLSIKHQSVREWLRFRNKLLKKIKKANKGILSCHYYDFSPCLKTGVSL